MLRPYQSRFLEHVTQWLQTAKGGDRKLYASPTGTGKSYMEKAILERFPHAWLITPRLEIVVGLLQKLGHAEADTWPEARVLAVAQENRIATPVRLRNAMLRGEFTARVDQLIFDEGHHVEANSWQQLELLTGRVPAVALTATPFRGTPRSTAAFRAAWGEPTWVITYPEAVAAGYISMPRVGVAALLDDDILSVANGEFQVAAVERETASRLADAVELVSSLWRAARRPTMVSVPTTEIARQLHAALAPSRLVTASTSPADRQEAFAACVASEAILVQINVVSEGVDLPIRRLIDLAPTLSPVRWLQQLGRITRPVAPGEESPSYVCTNRNLLRHAYLLEGCLPHAALAEAQAAFPAPSTRSAARVLGLEAIGRLKPAPLPLADGLQGQVYAFSAVDGAHVREYAVLLHPAREQAVWATRANAVKDDGTRSFGRWVRCEPAAELTGFASLPGSPVTPKQADWWTRSARRHGLNPDAQPTRKSFTALPVLSDLRTRI